MSSRRMMSAAALSLALLAVSSQAVMADMSRGVIAAFKGQIVVSKAELPTGKSDKDTIAKIKKEQLKEVIGTANEDVTGWTFHYTAFLSKSGASSLKMVFLKKDGNIGADKTLDGVDPKSTILEGDISINEDEGLAKGNTYTVQLLNGKTVVAKTTLTMK